MKRIKTIEDIKWLDYVEHQATMANLDTATTEEITKAFKSIYNASDETMKKISASEVYAYIGNITKLINDDKCELITKMKWNGITYGFIPSFGEITTGELIDLDTLLKDFKWTEIASILYRPIISESKNGTYLIEEYKSASTVFEDCSVRFFIGFINFFYKSYQILSQDSPISTIKN